MKAFSTLFFTAALLLLPAVKGQQTTGQQPPQPAAPAPQSVQGRNERSLDDNPEFKNLPPEQQQWVRQMAQRLDKAINEKDSAAIDQLAKETADHVNQLKNPAYTPNYVYQNVSPSTNGQTPNASAAKPPATSPCEVPPKRPSAWDRFKKHAQQTLEKQAGKADTKVGQASKGSVDIGVQDSTHTVITEAGQAKPCPPAKNQTKQ